MKAVEPFGYDDTDTASAADSWAPIDLNILPDKPPVQPTLGDVGIVYPGKRHVFSGPQESAKTLAAYVIGIRIVRAGGTIILIDFEMGAYDARNRLRELGANQDDFTRIHYLEPDQPATQERIQRLIALEPNLVIIDAAAGAYDLQGLDDNKRADAEKIARLYIRAFWRKLIATIMLDHVTKNSEQRGNYAIGSERKVGGADVHLGFEVVAPISRGNKGIYRIVTHKDRGGYLKRGALADLHLTSDPETHHIVCELKPVEQLAPGQEFLPTIVMQKVSGLLEQQTEPLTKNALADLAGGKRPVALDAIDHLIRLKYATSTAGPNRSQQLTHNRAFTILEWEHEDHDPVVPGGSQVVPGTTGGSLVPSGSLVVPGTSEVGGSQTVPPYGEREPLTTDGNDPVVPTEWDWIDELTEHEVVPLPDIDYSADPEEDR